jgi:hypothetical protein
LAVLVLGAGVLALDCRRVLPTACGDIEFAEAGPAGGRRCC